MRDKTLPRWQLASINLLILLFVLCVPSWTAKAHGTCGPRRTISHPSEPAVPNVNVKITPRETLRSPAAPTGIKKVAVSLYQDSVQESMGSRKPSPLSCANVWPCGKKNLKCQAVLADDDPEGPSGQVPASLFHFGERMLRL